ncbi:MAG TPA: alpha/beta family hydrolase [Usitatibacter sp.]|nr:alpha/beta family hydrolase [Usitatibacter sp.]
MAAPADRSFVEGAAGRIEIAATRPATPRMVAVIAHPHPLFGGTMDNKVVTTLARAFGEAGAATLRFNFRGVGATEGAHDEGRGEADDMVRVIEHARSLDPGLPLALAGFSFGGAVAVRASGRVDFAQLVLVAPGFRRITGEGMGAAPDPNDRELGAPGRHTTANTVIVHGDRDETVPLADSLGWAAPRDVPVIVVAGGEHFFHRKLHVLREIVVRWVR